MRRIATGKWGIAVLALVACSVANRPANATVVGCSATTVGKVVINHCSNHGYYERSLHHALPDLAGGLEQLRLRLLRRGRIAELPILIEMPWSLDRPPLATIERANDCVIDPGESESPAVSIGPCYRIVATRPPTDYPAWRAWVVGLSRLGASQPRLEVRNQQALDVQVGASLPLYAGISQRGTAYPSSAGKVQLSPIWIDGSQSFALEKEGRVIRWLPRLGGYLATDATWTSDGRRVAYASESEAKVHDVASGKTCSIPLLGRVGSVPPHQVELTFDRRGRFLLVMTDRDLFANYVTHALDASTGRVHRDVAEGPMPGWARVIEAVRRAKTGGAGPTASQRAEAQREVEALVAGL